MANNNKCSHKSAIGGNYEVIGADQSTMKINIVHCTMNINVYCYFFYKNYVNVTRLKLFVIMRLMYVDKNKGPFYHIVSVHCRVFMK